MFKRLILTTALLFMFVSTVSAWTNPQLRPYPSNFVVSDTIKVGDGTKTAPSITFKSWPSKGFFSVDDHTVAFTANGARVGGFDPAGVYGNVVSVVSAVPVMLNELATATNPVFAFGDDIDTGIGTAGADILSLIAGGVEGIRVTADPFVGVGVAPLGILHTAPSGALTTTAEEGFRIQAITSGTAGVGFGSFIRMQGEDAGAANRDMVLLQAEWNDATDSAADADFVVKVATNSAATTEKFRVKNTGSVRFVPTTVGALIACAAGLAGDNVYITFENSMCFCNGTNYVRYDDGTTCTDS